MMSKIQKQKDKRIDKNMAKIKIKSIEELQSKEYLTVQEAAALLGYSVRSIYLFIESGKLKAKNLSQRMTRIRRSDIDELFN